MPSRHRILGIDPGISKAGYAVIDYQAGEPKFVECGLIKIKSNQSQAQRFKRLYQGIKEVIELHQPEIMALEDSFLGKNFKSAKVLGGAKAIALLAGAESDIFTQEFSPREIKQSIVGQGGASKEQVKFMVKSILKLKEAPAEDDSSDALAVALCCAFRKHVVNGKLKS